MMAKKIEYLTFEGGGGKGIVYLGAIKALEKKELLPIPVKPIAEVATENFVTRFLDKDIKGISGASAGAITAFLLAMGLDSAQIAEIMTREFDGINKFLTFFDDPKAFIHQKNSNEDDIKGFVGLQRSVKIENNTIDLKSKKSNYPSNIIGGPLKRTLLSIIYKYIDFKFQIPDEDLLNRLTREPLERDYFIANLLYGKGLFNGFGIRTFFSELMNEFLIEPNKIYLTENARSFPFIKAKTPPHGLTFRHFFFLTGVDLRVTGVNLKKKRPYYFSAFHTPDFPVIEAIAISMNLPGIFRPISVESRNRTGEWIDGGLLTNYPIHAFDNVENEYKNTLTPGSSILSSDFAKDYDFDELPNEPLDFNPNVFGFDLVSEFPKGIDKKTKDIWLKRKAVKITENEGSEYNFNEIFEQILKLTNPLIPLPVKIQESIKKNIKELYGKDNSSKKKSEEQDIQILKLFGDLYNAFLYPSSEGQIRSKEERKNTINLPTYNLEVTEFAPFANPMKLLEDIESVKYKTPVHYAYNQVLEYLKE